MVIAASIFVFGYGIGLETCGMIYCAELLPGSANVSLGFFGWGINILICWTNVMMFYTSPQTVLWVFLGMTLFSKVFIACFFRETKDKSEQEILQSYQEKFKFNYFR